MITSTVNVVSTVPGMLAIDRLGRRPLLLWGAVGQAVGQLAVGLLGTLSTKQDENGGIIVTNYSAQKALIAFVCINIFFFAASWGPSTWVVTGEIYSLEVRAKAISLTTASLVSFAPTQRQDVYGTSRLTTGLLTPNVRQWLVNWALAYSTPYLVDYGSGYANLQTKIFFVWFGATIVMIVFVYFFIYETKGLTLEEVDKMYEEVKNARHSTRWVPPRHLFASHDAEEEKQSGIVEEQEA